jgi:hypothetical protein
MALKYLFQPYSDEILKQMEMGTNLIYPPHLILEVFYTPALANPAYAGWAIQQMGTRDFLARGFKTKEAAEEAAIDIAKHMVPNGIVFERE